VGGGGKGRIESHLFGSSYRAIGSDLSTHLFGPAL
jgi:hypothetical protein